MTEITFTATMSSPDELAKVMRAMAHPTRVRIVLALLETVRASPTELVAALEDEPLGNVSYHVRELYRRGVIELVDTQPRRGAVEHYYELTALGRGIAGGFAGATDAA